MDETEVAEEVITEEVAKVVNEEVNETGTTEETGEETNPDTEEEVVITIGEESPTHEDTEAPQWVKDLRKNHRETAKENRELKEKLNGLTVTAETVELGLKPTLASSDHDAGVFEKSLEDWQNRKRVIEGKKLEAVKTEKVQADAWQSTLSSHTQKGVELKAKNYDEAEAAAESSLSETQIGIIKHAADNSAKMMLALGTNPEQLEKLASIKDPIKFAVAAGKLETQLKTQTKRAATNPEKTVKGSGQLSGKTDKHREKLEAEADKTGDRGKIAAYNRELKRKQKE